MAPHYRHRHYYSLIFIFVALLVGGVIIYAAQAVSKKQSFDTGSRAAEDRLRGITPTPKTSPTPSLQPTPLPSGKPEILGESTSREVYYAVPQTSLPARNLFVNSLVLVIAAGMILLGITVTTLLRKY